MRAVNLLPRDSERARSSDGRRVPLLVGLGGFALVSAAAAVLTLSASGTITERRADLALTESAIAAVPSREQATATSGVVVQERADRVAALSAALSSRIPVDRVLRELSYVLPDDAWLTGLVANAPKEEDPAAAPQAGGARAPAGAGTAGVTIQGATFSHDSVARVLARLSLLPSLENVRLTASARIEPQSSAGGGDGKSKPRKQRPLVTFTIAADLRSGAQR